MSEKRKGQTRNTPCVLLVEPHEALGKTLSGWLAARECRVVLMHTALEATTALHDAVFTESQFDGLLTEFELPDARSYRVMSAFREEFPGRPIAVMPSQDDLCLKIWSRSHGIAVLRKPFGMDELGFWLDKVAIARLPLSPKPRRPIAFQIPA